MGCICQRANSAPLSVPSVMKTGAADEFEALPFGKVLPITQPFKLRAGISTGEFCFKVGDCTISDKQVVLMAVCGWKVGTAAASSSRNQSGGAKFWGGALKHLHRAFKVWGKGARAAGKSPEKPAAHSDRSGQHTVDSGNIPIFCR